MMRTNEALLPAVVLPVPQACVSAAGENSIWEQLFAPIPRSLVQQKTLCSLQHANEPTLFA